ncbi:DUF72 domain-containing protein [bacterium]|nr:DUF72 domain-containing protein [bacterium]
MSRYFVGTAGWSYQDWEGIVYPSKKSSSFHPLPFLAHYLNLVEINSTFYRIPSIRISLSWIKKIKDHPDFLFTVKLHQVFTHQRKDFSQKDVDDFKLGIEPLRAKNRLAAILLQFPWSFVNTTQNWDYLANLFGHFSHFPLALEVRHSSWDVPSFYDLLSEHRVSFCNIDQPLFRNSIKPSTAATNPALSYVRLHGQNYEKWFQKDAGRDERYNYFYTKKELQPWVERIKNLSDKSEKVCVVTNNHYRGQAFANALQIKNMLTREKFDIPSSLVERYPVLQEIIDQLKKGQLNLFTKS